MGTERYQIIISYDGTNFHGFQRQGKQRTIQGEIEQAINRLSWHGKSILAAGRTDTGVHASGQVVAFDLDWDHSEEDLMNALNANLPPDISVRKATVVAPDFHPRFDAFWRCYDYRLFYSPVRDPLRERFAWRINEKANIKSLQLAAEVICGTKDFSAFGSPPEKQGSTVRTVFLANWRSMILEEAGDGLRFRIVANSFLYHMVRRLVFIQVLVGQQRLKLSILEEAMKGVRTIQHGLAPAHGLCLKEIGYSNNYVLEF